MGKIQKEIIMGKLFLEQKLAIESKLVGDESMSILKEFEEIDDFSILENYSADE